MRKHSFLRGLTAFTLAGLLAFYSGVVQLPNVSAESITDLKSQLAELEKQEEENNKRLEELRDDVSQKRAYRDELQGKIDIIQQQLDILICILKRIIHQLELLGANVIVVQTVNDKCRAVEFIISQTVVGLLALVACGIVTGCPVRAVVTVQLNLVIINTVKICLIGVFDAVPRCVGDGIAF